MLGEMEFKVIKARNLVEGKERERLLLEIYNINIGLINSVKQSAPNWAKNSMDMQDIESEMWLAFMQAVDGYKSNYARFNTYLVSCCIKHLLKWLNGHGKSLQDIPNHHPDYSRDYIDTIPVSTPPQDNIDDIFRAAKQVNVTKGINCILAITDAEKLYGQYGASDKAGKIKGARRKYIEKRTGRSNGAARWRAAQARRRIRNRLILDRLIYRGLI